MDAGPLIGRGSIRVWVRGVQVEQWLNLDLADFQSAFQRWIEDSAAMLQSNPHMIEIEFLDAPSRERFYRFGTDDTMMVDPHAVDAKQFRRQ